MKFALLEALRLSHPQRAKIERALGLGKLIRLPHEPLHPFGQCYGNAAEQVRLHGGRTVHGWQVMIWPKLYVEAIHHAVWESPEGKLVDVTAKPPTDRRSYTTFAPDDTIDIDPMYPTFIPPKRLALRDEPELTRLFELLSRQLDQQRELVATMIAAGAKWTRRGLACDRRLEAQFRGEMAEARELRSHVGRAYDECARLQRNRKTAARM